MHLRTFVPWALVLALAACSSAEPGTPEPAPATTTPPAASAPPKAPDSPPATPAPSGPPGTLDRTFGDDGWTAALGGSVTGARLRILPDGGILVAGTKALNPSSDIVLARFGANGAPDRTFGTDGVVTIDFLGGSSDSLSNLFVEGERIWIVATARTPNTGWQTWLVALTPRGQPDTTFAPGGRKIVSDESETGNDSAVLRPEGFLVSHTKFQDNSVLVRYDRTGARDPLFPAVKHYALGALELCGGRVFARYGAWAELDNTGRRGADIPSSYQLAFCTDRTLVGVGIGSELDSDAAALDWSFSASRRSLDGVVDTTWRDRPIALGRTAFGETITPTAGALDEKGRLVFSQRTHLAKTTVLRRLSADGSTFDPSFGGGSVATKTIQHVHVTASGAILVVTDELSLGRYFP